MILFYCVILFLIHALLPLFQFHYDLILLMILVVSSRFVRTFQFHYDLILLLYLYCTSSPRPCDFNFIMILFYFIKKRNNVIIISSFQFHYDLILFKIKITDEHGNTISFQFHYDLILLIYYDRQDTGYT